MTDDVSIDHDLTAQDFVHKNIPYLLTKQQRCRNDYSIYIATKTNGHYLFSETTLPMVANECLTHEEV